MVRIWYEPPPYGPMTDLNRSPYKVHGGPYLKKFLERCSKTPTHISMTVPIAIITVMSYMHVSNPTLPFSMDPEYQATQRAYMRYHNMNPIFGISSKSSREKDAQ